MLKRAHVRQDPAFAILPIKNFGTDESDNQRPFMRSVFYRANRVPSNEQFSMKSEDHMQKLIAAVQGLVDLDHSSGAITARRIPKYHSMLRDSDHIKILPSREQSSEDHSEQQAQFDFTNDDHCKQLVNEALRIRAGQSDSPQRQTFERLGGHDSPRSTANSTQLQRSSTRSVNDIMAENKDKMKCILVNSLEDHAAAKEVRDNLKKYEQIKVCPPVDSDDPEAWYDQCNKLDPKGDLCIVLLSKVRLKTMHL